jgi:Ser-tRNA(Ala) deacylase AlaX
MTNMYLVNPYLRCNKSRINEIRKIKGKCAISLEENIFYPGGGGQPHDKGSIYFEDQEHRVEKVQKIDKKDFLILSHDADITLRNLINAEIDWDRRFSYMRCHTAAHVLMRAIKNNVENYVPNGINIAESGDSFIVKFKGNWNSTPENGSKFVELANDIIRRDLNVAIKNYKSISEAINEYKLLYRGPSDMPGDIRLIIIEGWDANPCGGTHVSHLQEVGGLGLIDIGNHEITVSLIDDKGDENA